jgi:hypothetical protein
MKQQFVVTITVCQSEILSLLDNRVANTPSVKILYPQKKIASSYIFVKNHVMQCWSIKDLLSFFVSAVKLSVGGLQEGVLRDGVSGFVIADILCTCSTCDCHI